MLHTFVIDPDWLKVDMQGDVSEDVPLAFAPPYNAKGYPVGLLAADGQIYNAVPEGLPALFMYKRGNVEIRKTYTVKHLMRAKAVVSGSALLVEDYTRVTPLVSPLNTYTTRRLERLGLGLLGDGTLLVVAMEGTVEDLQDIFMHLDVEDGMMLAFNNIYLNYARGGVQIMGNDIRPITTLQAIAAKELERPLLVLDGGHGGRDPGACAFGLKEKDFTLKGTQYIREFLSNNYKGTFVLTREADSTVELGVRGRQAVQLKADGFFSFHVNAGRGTGYEDFCHPNATKVTQTMRHIIHQSVAAYMTSHGVRDRGEKFANYQVLRDACKGGVNAVLLECLFIDTLADAKKLQDNQFFIGYCQAVAEGIAKAVGLPKKTPVATSNVQGGSQVLYKVQVGAFQYRKGAETLQQDLKNKGYSAIVVEDDGR